MPIVLRMEPAVTPVSWRKFCKQSPQYSIAIDGYVNESPKLDPNGPRANFDHHNGVSRLETRATCAQVLIAVRMGLFQMFRRNEEPTAIVHANDCDQDVCTAWTVFNNHYLADHSVNPKLNRLVDLEDKLDSTAGAYPFHPDLPLLRELAWIFEPYTQFRLSGGLNQRSANAFSSIVTDVESRILKHISDKGQSIPLDFRYETIDGGPGWSMVKETGAQARTKMYHDGIKAFCSVSDRENGRYNYVIGRMSEFIPFELLTILKNLKKAEGKQKDQWGGASTVIGSPRINGSKLPPDEVKIIINDSIPKKADS